MQRLPIVLSLAVVAAAPAVAEEPAFGRVPIFPVEPVHNHASCLVELPDGDLYVAWYRGSGERRADDVQILAARKPRGEEGWGERFVLADTPGYPDCNPALFVAPDETLWLFYPTILDHRWEGALLKFAVADADAIPDEPRPPVWSRQGVFHVTPTGFAEAMQQALASLDPARLKLDESDASQFASRSKDLLYQRLGWMPRVHPTALPSGRWLLPLYTDTFSASIVAYSDDRGASWSFSRPLIGFGNIQPSLVRKADGSVVAFMRDNGPFRRIRQSTSDDQGETWSPVVSTDLPNPGAGVEAIRLEGGLWALVYNDTAQGRHSLAISISEDEGATWKWTRHIARAEPGRESFHYPSILQARDGRIHVSYTHGGTPQGSTIEHAWFDREWVQQGDPSE